MWQFIRDLACLLGLPALLFGSYYARHSSARPFRQTSVTYKPGTELRCSIFLITTHYLCVCKSALDIVN